MGIVSFSQKYSELYPNKKKWIGKKYFDITPLTIVHLDGDSPSNRGMFLFSLSAKPNFCQFLSVLVSKYFISLSVTSAWPLDWWWQGLESSWVMFSFLTQSSNSDQNGGPPSDLIRTGLPISMNQSFRIVVIDFVFSFVSRFTIGHSEWRSAKMR